MQGRATSEGELPEGQERPPWGATPCEPPAYCKELYCSSSVPDFLARNGHFLARKYTEQRRAEDRTEEESRAEHSREQQSRNKIENGE